MKKKNHSLTLAAIMASCSCLTIPVAAYQTQNYNDVRASVDQRASSRVAYQDLQKADKIIGMDVVDTQEKKLGVVKDLAVDLRSGRLAEVIVGKGGLVGMDEKMIAVPPQAFTFANSGKELRLADGDTFRTAPYFKMSDFKDYTSSASVMDAYGRFHVTAPLDRNPGYLERADKIMGMTAKNAQKDHLGKVENLVVDLSGGRVVEVILSSGGFLGIKDELSAVPPQAFAYVPGENLLTLATTKEALKNAPHFKAADWRSSVNDAASLSGVYNAYNVPPYFTPGSTDTTVQNAAPNHVTMPAQGVEMQSDMVITTRIQDLFHTTEGLSADARAVQITTQSGHVTLRGLADSDMEKKQLGDLAATVVPSDHIDNQIQVKNIGATTSIND